MPDFPIAKNTFDLPPLGGDGKVVEADETYFGEIPEAKRPKFKTTGRPFQKDARGPKNKRAILALVERGGEVRSFHVPSAYAGEVASIVRKNITRETRLHTDESKIFHRVGQEFSAHETVNHAAKEYARDVTANKVEGYFSIFTRYARGVSALRRKASSPLSGGVRFPLQRTQSH